jgi:hypothetical protein
MPYILHAQLYKPGKTLYIHLTKPYKPDLVVNTTEMTPDKRGTSINNSPQALTTPENS